MELATSFSSSHVFNWAKGGGGGGRLGLSVCCWAWKQKRVFAPIVNLYLIKKKLKLKIFFVKKRKQQRHSECFQLIKYKNESALILSQLNHYIMSRTFAIPFVKSILGLRGLKKRLESECRERNTVMLRFSFLSLSCLSFARFIMFFPMYFWLVCVR